MGSGVSGVEGIGGAAGHGFHVDVVFEDRDEHVLGPVFGGDWESAGGVGENCVVSELRRVDNFGA